MEPTVPFSTTYELPLEKDEMTQLQSNEREYAEMHRPSNLRVLLHIQEPRLKIFNIDYHPLHQAVFYQVLQVDDTPELHQRVRTIVQDYIDS